MNFRKFAAISLAIPSILFSSAASAEDLWGCEVLLCLSNPAGPMAVAQCVPPITRLYRAIFKTNPDPFPTCAMARGPNGERNEATPHYNDYYDPCPTGTRALGQGSYAVHQSQVKQGNGGRFSRPSAPLSAVLSGIGEGGYGYSDGDGGTSFPTKVCVGNQTGSVSVDFGSGSEYSDYRSVGIYDQIKLLPAHRNGFSIKVYQNNGLLHVVRPNL